MPFDPSDLEAAFEAAGVESLTVTRRGKGWGRKWVAHATFPHDDWRKRPVRASEPNTSLEAALVELLKMAPKRPAPPVDDLDDLL